jgi:excisionase family DNA binding protein
MENTEQEAKARELLTPDDVARLIGCGTQTLAAWRCTRRVPLPFVKIGRLVRYRRVDVETFLDARTVSAAR